jgi:hypothetical protein
VNQPLRRRGTTGVVDYLKWSWRETVHAQLVGTYARVLPFSFKGFNLAELITKSQLTKRITTGSVFSPAAWGGTVSMESVPKRGSVGWRYPIAAVNRMQLVYLQYALCTLTLPRFGTDFINSAAREPDDQTAPVRTESAASTARWVWSRAFGSIMGRGELGS